MFDSLFASGVTEAADISVGTALLCLFAALIYGGVISLVYISCGEHTKSFAVSLVLLPPVVQAVIMLVNGSLGMSVAVLGTFSLVRFRSVPGNAREISCIFLTMAVGLACGAGYVVYGLLITVVLCLVLFLLSKLPFGEAKATERALKVLLPEDLDYTEVFDDVFAEFTSAHTLTRVKTTNMGSMYELSYSVNLKSPQAEKKMIDAIRRKNGNLPVCCGHSKTHESEM